MKRINILSTFLLCLILNTIQAQNTAKCIHCNMAVNDKSHKAAAKINNNALEFDAIECLINYLKNENENSFSSLKVADYTTKNLIDAKTAIYLKSKGIPSPMGANLSAFKNKKDAIKLKNKKGGEIYNWTEIKAKFKDSKFGAIDHSHHDHYRPDAHAPIGIMGDHLHTKGGLMLSFRYMNMAMDGNKSGTNAIDDVSIYNSFMVAPQEMTMHMYMIGVMYAPSDRLTLMAMQSYTKKDMNLTARMMMNGMPMLRNFSTSSTGFGDLKIGALISLYNNHKTSLHLNGNINIPIGDIENRDNTPMMDNVKLPYTMQLGSGTFDLTLGATYKQNFANTSWGTQFLSTIRTGENSEAYRFGNLYQLNIWGAYKITTNLSISARLFGINESKLKGIDSDLNPMMVTTANIANYGSDKIKSFVGINLAFPKNSRLKNLRFGIEIGTPIYEDYNGIQMNENISINTGFKYNVL